jgi:hypothetical protein
VRFHFDSAPGIESALQIRSFGSDDRGDPGDLGDPIEEKGFVSHCYGEKRASTALSFAATLQGDGDVITFLLPPKPGTEWTVTEIETKDGRAFEVGGANSRDVVIIPRSGAWVWTRTPRTGSGQVRETVST